MSVLVEGEHSLLTNQLLEFLSIRNTIFDFYIIVLLNLFEELVCLGMQPPSVEREHSEWKPRLFGVFDQYHILSATEADSHITTERLEGVLDHVLRRLR